MQYLSEEIKLISEKWSLLFAFSIIKTPDASK